MGVRCSASQACDTRGATNASRMQSHGAMVKLAHNGRRRGTTLAIGRTSQSDSNRCSRLLCPNSQVSWTSSDLIVPNSRVKPRPWSSLLRRIALSRKCADSLGNTVLRAREQTDGHAYVLVHATAHTQSATRATRCNKTLEKTHRNQGVHGLRRPLCNGRRN